MNRRRLLRAISAGSVFTTAGCVGQLEYKLSAGQDADCKYDSEAIPTVSEFSYPEGASESGLKNGANSGQRSNTLVSNHQAHLERRWKSATITHQQTRTVGNTEYTSETVAQFGEGNTHIREVNESGVVQDNWPDGNGDTYVRAKKGDSVRYYLSTYNRGSGIAIGQARYDELIDAGEYEATDVVRVDGAVVVKYTATTASNGQALTDLTGTRATPESFSAELYLQCNGVIRKGTYELSVMTQETQTTYTGESSVSKLGETTVSAPSWLSTAEEQAVELSLYEVADDNSYLALAVERGETIPEKTNVLLGTANWEGQTKNPISAGDVIYLWGIDDTLHITKQRPTGETTPIYPNQYGRFKLSMKLPNGLPVYTGDFKP